MIRSIQRLRHFGVFQDFRKTTTLPEFGTKNIIYGWNYSGKTTLSRLFSSLGQGQIYSECPTATFDVQCVGRSVTETMIASSGLKVEVFNSDFVASNLSWTGEDFQSILLLGDAVEAEKEIEHLSARRVKCRSKWVHARDVIAEVDARSSDAKTKAAKDIKQTLQIVDTFTATHLTAEVSRLPKSVREALLSEDAYKNDMRLALASEQERPPAVSAVYTPALGIVSLSTEATELMAYLPSITATVEHLRTHAHVARWVEQGLDFHATSGACEFCLGQLTEARLRELRDHFSRDLATHRVALNGLLAKVRAAKISTTWLTPAEFTPPFQTEATSVQRQLQQACEFYNDEVALLENVIQEKIDDPFVEHWTPPIFPSVETILSQFFEGAKDLIKRHNDDLGKFGNEKKASIARLKTHFAAKFSLDPVLQRDRLVRERMARFQRRLKPVGEEFNRKIQELHAKVDRAQKGRERLNERIVGLLGSDAIQIEVVKANGQDRFALRRRGQPARNLSDGERTAIAFAFFLTKLEEHKSLEEVIVYIDDPISSLDSNHMFQIYSAIEVAFFRREKDGRNERAVTRCKQLFVSTHNFEFFEMLKGLPQKKGKYFLVKRVSPDASTIVELPESLFRYKSEYHYLFSVIRSFSENPAKDDLEHILALPNALRRFLELYTYMRLPWPDSNMEKRLGSLIGAEKSGRIAKLLHHFSHLEVFDRVATHTNVIADIEAVAAEVMQLIKDDRPHFDALMGDREVAEEILG